MILLFGIALAILCSFVIGYLIATKVTVMALVRDGYMTAEQHERLLRDNL